MIRAMPAEDLSDQLRPSAGMARIIARISFRSASLENESRFTAAGPLRDCRNFR
jgi:hypothetical protein